MRVLYISYTKHGAGSRIHAAQFFSAFQAIHNKAMIYPPISSGAQLRGNNRGSSKFRSNSKAFRGGRMFASMFTKKLLSEVRVLKNFSPSVVILRPDHYFSSLVLSRWWKIPTILEVNGPVLEFRLAKFPVRGLFFLEWIEKYIFLKLATHVTVVSEPLRQYYIGRGIPPGKMTTIPNGVNVKKFSPDVDGEKLREELGLAGKTVLGFSGTFAPWHGVEFLLETVAKLIHNHLDKRDDIALLLIGEPGPQFVMPDIPGGYTVTTGYVPHDDMPAYLAAVDIFVAPYPRIEPFYFSPLKIFEAMAVGKPVLASAQGQIRELITDGVNGLLYPPGDMSCLLHKLDLVINDNELRRKLGHAAREKIVRNYTWENNAHTVLNLCQQLKRDNFPER